MGARVIARVTRVGPVLRPNVPELRHVGLRWAEAVPQAGSSWSKWPDFGSSSGQAKFGCTWLWLGQVGPCSSPRIPITYSSTSKSRPQFCV
jgi:hypothetical protein